jgi:hypothetical protein
MKFAPPSYYLVITPVPDTCVEWMLVMIGGILPHQSGTLVYLFNMSRFLVRGTEYVTYLFSDIHYLLNCWQHIVASSADSGGIELLLFVGCGSINMSVISADTDGAGSAAPIINNIKQIINLFI